MMRPLSMTNIWCASTTVDRRCAITSVVLCCAMLCNWAWMARSLAESSADVASSKIRIGGVFSKGWGCLEQGAGYRPPLLVAARELEPALAHQRAVALGRGGDEVVDAGRPRS